MSYTKIFILIITAATISEQCYCMDRKTSHKSPYTSPDAISEEIKALESDFSSYILHIKEMLKRQGEPGLARRALMEEISKGNYEGSQNKLSEIINSFGTEGLLAMVYHCFPSYHGISHFERNDPYTFGLGCLVLSQIADKIRQNDDMKRKDKEFYLSRICWEIEQQAKLNEIIEGHDYSYTWGCSKPGKTETVILGDYTYINKTTKVSIMFIYPGGKIDCQQLKKVRRQQIFVLDGVATALYFGGSKIQTKELRKEEHLDIKSNGKDYFERFTNKGKERVIILKIDEYEK